MTFGQELVPVQIAVEVINFCFSKCSLPVQITAEVDAQVRQRFMSLSRLQFRNAIRKFGQESCAFKMAFEIINGSLGKSYCPIMIAAAFINT